tara:strand:+ start:629 stop:1126 length:498 start_codon:yes stop_codon:yes gene_type:complete
MMWFWIVAGITVLFGFVVARGAPYVPTRRKLIDKALTDLYPLSDKDVLVDIGSGDGMVLRAAARRGARAIGYELNPVLVVVSKLLSRSSLVSVRLADFWFVTLPLETTIIYTFGDSRDIKKMYHKAEQTASKHKKNLYFMSFGFAVPGKKPLRRDHSFYLYKVKG